MEISGAYSVLCDLPMRHWYDAFGPARQGRAQIPAGSVPD